MRKYLRLKKLKAYENEVSVDLCIPALCAHNTSYPAKHPKKKVWGLLEPAALHSWFIEHSTSLLNTILSTSALPSFFNHCLIVEETQSTCTDCCKAEMSLPGTWYSRTPARCAPISSVISRSMAWGIWEKK